MTGWVRNPQGMIVWGEGTLVDPAKLFGPQLATVRDRLASLGYFITIEDIQNAALAIEQSTAFPPAAFVSIAGETAEANRTTGGHAQRVATRLSVLFCILLERSEHDADDAAEQLRKVIIRLLTGWMVPGSLSPLNYDRFLVRRAGDGLFWGEVLFTTTYRLSDL